MPFIKQSRRYQIKTYGLDKLDIIEPGDRCYVYYKQMVDQWRAEPRWTTAHDIFKRISVVDFNMNSDEESAQFLAWQVFFQLYVMPYELKKREENGDV